MLLQAILNGIVTGLLYSLVALGFGLIYASVKVFDIACGALYVASAYCLLLWTAVVGKLFAVGGRCSLLLSSILAVATILLASTLIFKGVYRPLLERRATRVTLFVSSLGLYIVIVNAISLAYGSQPRLLNTGSDPAIEIATMLVTRTQFVQVIASITLILLTFLLLKGTSLGRNIRALSDHPVLLSIQGVSPTRVGIVVYGGASVLISCSSILKAIDIGFDPHIGLPAFLAGAVAAIVAGTGAYRGTVIWGVFLGVMQSAAIYLLSARWQDAVSLGVLMVVLLVRREGHLAHSFAPGIPVDE